MEDKQEMIDIVETVYRGARKGRGLVVSPKDYSTKYRYWFPPPPLWYFVTWNRDYNLQMSRKIFPPFFCRWNRTIFLLLLVVTMCHLCVCLFVDWCVVEFLQVFFFSWKPVLKRPDTIHKSYLKLLINMNIYIWSFVSLVDYRDKFYYITAPDWGSVYGGCRSDYIQTSKKAVLSIVRLAYIHFICLDTAAALPALSDGVETCYTSRVQVTAVMLETSCEWNQPPNILENVVFVMTMQTLSVLGFAMKPDVVVMFGELVTIETFSAHAQNLHCHIKMYGLPSFYANTPFDWKY